MSIQTSPSRSELAVTRPRALRRASVGTFVLSAGSSGTVNIYSEVAGDGVPRPRSARAPASSSAQMSWAFQQRVRNRQPRAGSPGRHVASSRSARLPRVVRHDRHGRQQRLRVRMHGRLVDRSRAELDDLAEVHHRDPVRDVPDDGEVVRDEQVRRVELVLQLLEQVDDLAWIDTSSAETGSSSTSSSGLSASARAMPMRCRWPPENSCGKRLRVLGAQPDGPQQALHLASPLLAA